MVKRFTCRLVANLLVQQSGIQPYILLLGICFLGEVIEGGCGGGDKGGGLLRDFAFSALPRPAIGWPGLEGVHSPLLYLRGK
jgi:hypothetical protein